MTSQKEDNNITSLMTQYIQHSILNLCNEHISFCRTLHVLGVLSLTIDSREQEILIKINDTIKKVGDPVGHDGDSGTEALMGSGSEEPIHSSDEEVHSTPISIEPRNCAPIDVRADQVVQSDASDISPEDHGEVRQHGVDETPLSMLKLRGRKQSRPIKLNNNTAKNIIENKPSDDDNTGDRTDDTSNNVCNIIPDGVISNDQFDDVDSDSILQNKRQKFTVNDDTIDNRSGTSETDVPDLLSDRIKADDTLLAIDLIKQERSSPPLLLEENTDFEKPINCAIDCSRKLSEQLPKHFQSEESTQHTVDNYFHKSPVTVVAPDEKWQSDEPDAQPLSVRKLLTSNSHRSNSMIEHLEKIAAFRRYGNFCFDGSASARTRLVMSQSRNLLSQLSSEMSKPIVIQPIYQQSPIESYQHLQPMWSSHNNVQETALNFSIQALNGEAEKDRRSPKERIQQSSFQSSPSTIQSANPYDINLSAHPNRSGKISHPLAQTTSIGQNSFVYGLPSYDILNNNLQSFLKQAGNNVNASNISRNVIDDSGVSALRNAGYGSLFTRNAALFQNSQRLHPRRTLPGSLAWCSDKPHQKRIRKAMVNSNKEKKVAKFDETMNKDGSHEVQHVSPQKSSGKIEGQYLVDSMSPETTRKRRRRGLDEALTTDEIAEYMGVEVDGTKPTCFACKYCTEESQDLCSYLSHTVTAHGAYICHQCAKIFTTKSSLLRHRPIHTGMRRFTCSICQRSFYRKDKCKAHIKKHLEMTGEDSGETNRQEILNDFQLVPAISSSILLPAPTLSLAVQ